MRNDEYWEQAALLREIAIQEGATHTAAEVLELYDGALKDIQNEIRTIKFNFKKRYGIDDKTAEYHLSRARLDDNMNTLIELLENAPDAAARKKILDYIHRDGLSVRAYSARIERYEQLKTVIYARTMKIAAESTGIIGDMLKSAYKESYYGLIDDAARGLDVGIGFTVLNDNAINEAVNAKWNGKRFSKRIWDNTDRLATEAQNLIVKSLISGESYTKTSRKLAEAFDVEKYHATTLIHTETAHIHGQADLKAYKDLGVQEYKYLATLDYRTCETCQPLDGKVFKLSAAREGVNYPTMHPRCRCTTTMNIDYGSRRARNPLSGKNEIVDGNVTYSQWIDSLTPEEKAALELSRKKDDNKTSDKLQYKQYQEVIGRMNVPKTFDKWQELKYNGDRAEYEDLKQAYRYINANAGADINAFHCAKELKQIGVKGSIHIPKKDIAVVSLIFDDEHINHQRKHNVSESEAKGYISNALMSITKRNGLTENYYSYSGVAYVNPSEQIIKTAFSEREFSEEVLSIVEVLKKYGY